MSSRQKKDGMSDDPENGVLVPAKLIVDLVGWVCAANGALASCRDRRYIPAAFGKAMLRQGGELQRRLMKLRSP